MLPAGWKPIRLLHSPSLDIHENGTSLYNFKKKKVEGVVCSKGVTLKKKKKGFVYIKIDVTGVNIVPH